MSVMTNAMKMLCPTVTYFDVINRCAFRDGEVFRNEVDFLQCFGEAFEGGDIVHEAVAGSRLLQTTDELQQGGLTHAIFTQKSINVAFFKVQADVLEDWLILVTEV